MKTRAAFCLITTPLTRTSRQVCADILHIRRAARQPVTPINIALIKQECQSRFPRSATSLTCLVHVCLVLAGQARLSTKKHRLRRLVSRKRFETSRLALKINVDITAPKTALLQPSAPAPARDYYRFPHRDPEISESDCLVC